MFFQVSVPARIGGPTWNLLADVQQIFQYEFMQNAFIAGTIVAILAGMVGYFVVLRRLSFAAEALCPRRLRRGDRRRGLGVGRLSRTASRSPA